MTDRMPPADALTPNRSPSPREPPERGTMNYEQIFFLFSIC